MVWKKKQSHAKSPRRIDSQRYKGLVSFAPFPGEEKVSGIIFFRNDIIWEGKAIVFGYRESESGGCWRGGMVLTQFAPQAQKVEELIKAKTFLP